MADWLAPELRQRLSRYQLLTPRQASRSSLPGRHRGRRRGRSLEFAEHRDYVAGDDLRHLDWSAFARHEKLVVKEFESELDRVVMIVVDLSLSMGSQKARTARQVASALAWVGLSGHDRVSLATLGGAGGYHPPVRGRDQWRTLMNWLWQQPEGGRAGLSDALRRLAQRLGGPNLMLVLSDWLEPQAWESLAYPHFARHELRALQLLDGDDLQPGWSGPLELVDRETGESRRLSLDESTRTLYQQALAGHGQQLASACRRRGFGWLSCDCRSPLDDLVLRQLVREGWLR